MKRNSILLILLVFSCGYSFAQPSFQYKRQVMGVEKEGWHSLALSGELLARLNYDLADLRLYALSDGDTSEIPYLLRIEHEKIMKQEVSLPLFNTSYTDGRLFLTFELQQTQKVNSLRLEFDERNYFGHVTLEGSDDRNKWFGIVRDERIVSIQKQGSDYKLSTIRFPLSSYRYLRANVNADTRLHFTNASFAYDSVTPGHYRDLPLSWQVTVDKDRQASIVDVKLMEYAPVSSLRVNVDSERDYYRSFDLEYVRDSTRTEKGWIRNYQHAFSGYLTSYEMNEFDFPHALTNRLRLVIHDRDNPTLSISRISAEGPYITIVTYLKPGNISLFYGSAQTGQPSYDLTHFENTIPENVTVAHLGAEEFVTGPEDDAKPLFESPIWLWSIMGVMIAGLGFFTIKMMKSK